VWHRVGRRKRWLKRKGADRAQARRHTDGRDPRAAVVVEAHATSRSAGLRQTANDGSSGREYGAPTIATGVHGGGVEAVVSMAAAWVRHGLGCRGVRRK
jgi:hypothetical protein